MQIRPFRFTIAQGIAAIGLAASILAMALSSPGATAWQRITDLREGFGMDDVVVARAWGEKRAYHTPAYKLAQSIERLGPDTNWKPHEVFHESKRWRQEVAPRAAPTIAIFRIYGVVYVLSLDRTTLKVGAKSGVLRRVYSTNSSAVMSSHDKSILAIGGSGIELNYYKGGGMLSSGTSFQVSCLAFSSDDALLAAGGASDKEPVKIFDVRLGEWVARIGCEGSFPNCLEFSPRQAILAIGTNKGLILHDVVTGTRAKGPIDERVTDVAFSARGGLIATASNRRGVVVSKHESALSYKEIYRLPSADAIDFTRRGNVLVSATSDGQVHFWDAERGTLQRTVTLPAPSVRPLFPAALLAVLCAGTLIWLSRRFAA